MNIQNIKPLHKLCLSISEIKQQLIEELPHYGNQALYFNNDEITTGLLNNKVEIKIHLPSGQLLYHNDEQGIFVDLYTDDISKRLGDIAQSFNITIPEEKLENLNFEKLSSFHEYAIPAKRILENFRMTLRNNFTQIHLWPHHFDFSVEWYSGIEGQQIGTGISPGDEHYSEPYLYMNPFPFNEKVLEQNLPLGTWNTEDWKGVKIEWKDILKYPSQNASIKLREVFDIVKMNFQS